jgi:alkylation response protein AidB-like acyl-CoA dehydrogenase
MNDENKVASVSTSHGLADPVAAARELTPLIRTYAGESERGRRLAAPVVDALRSARLFTMGLPASLGGSETPVAAALQAIEQIAYADGATGWNVMIAFDTGFMAGFLHAPQPRALIASIRQPILSGSVSPPGRLVRTAGGYRLTGRWRFGSGCQQADLFVVGAVLGEDGSRVMGTNVMHDILWVTVPAAEVTIADTWHVAGLRGTGSHDFAVEDLFIAEGFVEPVHLDAPSETGPLYALGVIPAFGIVKAAVAVGIARHAIEALKELALAKTPTGQTSLLRERPAVQADLARAQACVRSARALMDEVAADVWHSVINGGRPSIEQRAWLRLAGVDGVQRAIEAVDLMYKAGGGTAIYESSPLERCFRDVHVVPAHIVVQPSVYEVAGRVFLNLPPGTALF